jgi:DNA (cytosine-5)-methyltransferase 1
LDLFCGAGGAGMGYHRAGFEVVGIDIAPQPNNPLGAIKADALAVFEDEEFVKAFDAIHASPPCQHYTKYGNSVKDIKDRYDDLIAPTRELLISSGLPYVIENVERSPLLNPVKLCGSMFDGRGTNDIQRHRLLETNWPLVAPGKCDHSIWEPNRYVGGRSGQRGGSWVLCRKTIEIGRWSIPLETQKWAMGIDWDITQRELSEALPPAYTEYIGYQLRAFLLSRIGVAA